MTASCDPWHDGRRMPLLLISARSAKIATRFSKDHVILPNMRRPILDRGSAQSAGANTLRWDGRPRKRGIVMSMTSTRSLLLFSSAISNHALINPNARVTVNSIWRRLMAGFIFDPKTPKTTIGAQPTQLPRPRISTPLLPLA